MIHKEQVMTLKCVCLLAWKEITFYFKGSNCFKTFRAAALTVVPKSPTVGWLQTKRPPLVRPKGAVPFQGCYPKWHRQHPQGRRGSFCHFEQLGVSLQAKKPITVNSCQRMKLASISPRARLCNSGGK